MLDSQGVATCSTELISVVAFSADVLTLSDFAFDWSGYVVSLIPHLYSIKMPPTSKSSCFDRSVFGWLELRMPPSESGTWTLAT